MRRPVNRTRTAWYHPNFATKVASRPVTGSTVFRYCNFGETHSTNYFEVTQIPNFHRSRLSEKCVDSSTPSVSDVLYIVRYFNKIFCS